MELSESKQHYIRAIYNITLEEDGARVSDIATTLNVTKASVSRGIDNLVELGLVERNSHRRAILTHEGVVQAVSLADKFYIIERFLQKILRVSPEVAHTDACALEHVLSNETLCAMVYQLQPVNNNLGKCVPAQCTWPNTKKVWQNHKKNQEA